MSSHMARRRYAQLQQAIRELADDCEQNVKNEYGWPDVHPAVRPKFDRDMAWIAERRALTKGENAPERTGEVVARKVGCPHCGRDLFVETEASLFHRIAELEQAIRWLVNLAHDVGRAGGNPESAEWEAAWDNAGALIQGENDG